MKKSKLSKFDLDREIEHYFLLFQLMQTAAPQDRLSRELKRLQFAGAGPKMQKISAPGRPSASQLNSKNF